MCDSQVRSHKQHAFPEQPVSQMSSHPAGRWEAGVTFPVFAEPAMLGCQQGEGADGVGAIGKRVQVLDV